MLDYFGMILLFIAAGMMCRFLYSRHVEKRRVDAIRKRSRRLGWYWGSK